MLHCYCCWCWCCCCWTSHDHPWWLLLLLRQRLTAFCVPQIVQVPAFWNIKDARCEVSAVQCSEVTSDSPFPLPDRSCNALVSLCLSRDGRILNHHHHQIAFDFKKWFFVLWKRAGRWGGLKETNWLTHPSNSKENQQPASNSKFWLLASREVFTRSLDYIQHVRHRVLQRKPPSTHWTLTIYVTDHGKTRHLDHVRRTTLLQPNPYILEIKGITQHQHNSPFRYKIARVAVPIKSNQKLEREQNGTAG